MGRVTVPGLPLHRFSRRTGWDRTVSELEHAFDSASVPPSTPIDLTTTNPTACGFGVDAAAILEPLGDPRSLRYRPTANGLHSTRAAIAERYDARGATVTPAQLVLTSSTSEAYSHLFRLLCDPGDEVLVPRPSYPLLDYLADLCDVGLRPFPLFRDHGWWIDIEQLERSIGPRTRAIVIIHPNNPTGHLTRERERDRLHELCLKHGLCLVVDEVFLDYTHRAIEPAPSFAAGPQPHLTMVVDGLSKLAALPQMKVGWILALGPAEVRDEALARLEIIADTFLSVSTPAQLAVPAWLAQAASMQRQILDRISRNLDLLHGAAADLDPVEAGWSAILRLPRLFGEDSAFATLRAAGVLTHPAHFYHLSDPQRVVISLIVAEETMQRAVAVINTLVAAAGDVRRS